MADRKIAVLDGNALRPGLATCVDHYTAGTVAASMGLSNLLTDEPSERARLLTHDPYDTYWQFALSSWSTTALGAALCNVNLSRFGHYRFLADPNDLLSGNDIHNNYIKRLAPSALLASSNFTSGGVTDVDESPRTPDANWMLGTSGTPGSSGWHWTARFSFPTPAASLATGAKKQAFVVWTRQTNGTAKVPVVNCQLWENGALVSDLGTKTLISTSGQTLIFRWDAALLADVTGAGVEIQLRGSCDSNSAIRSDLGALAWDYEQASPHLIYDSGWLDSPFDVDSESVLEPTKNLQHIPSVAWPTIGLLVLISDDQADDRYTFTSERTVPLARLRTQDGYTQAGVAVLADTMLQPSLLNFSKGPLVSVRDSSVLQFSLGGQESGSRRVPRRIMPVELPLLTSAEGWSIFTRLDYLAGKKIPHLVIGYPDGDSNEMRHLCLWATLEDMPGLSLRNNPDRKRWSGLFVEKL